VARGRQEEEEMTGRDLLFKEDTIRMIKLWEKESREHLERSLKESDKLTPKTDLEISL
jgi:hypothetical protein